MGTHPCPESPGRSVRKPRVRRQTLTPSAVRWGFTWHITKERLQACRVVALVRVFRMQPVYRLYSRFQTSLCSLNGRFQRRHAGCVVERFKSPRARGRTSGRSRSGKQRNCSRTGTEPGDGQAARPQHLSETEGSKASQIRRAAAVHAYRPNERAAKVNRADLPRPARAVVSSALE